MELETVTGGSNLEVVDVRGQKHNVRVMQIPVDMWPKAIDVAFDEPRFIELVTTQEKGFADSLTPQSRTRLAEEAERVNEDFLASLARRARMLNRVAPGIMLKAAGSR